MIRDLRGVLGTVCDPHAAFLVGRGLKTLALRVDRQNASALAIATRLAKHPRVKRVYYPGIETHPSHGCALSQMHGYGGLVSFVVNGDLQTTSRFVDAVKLARIGPSFGGVETLIEQPAVMSYYGMTTEQRSAVDIDDGLVRLSVGIEEVGDLIADLEEALASMA
jgi:cystathionine gamma-synthase